MRKTRILILLFFQVVPTISYADHTCSLIQTRLKPSKLNTTNVLRTRSSRVTSDYKRILHRRCDAGHRIPGKVWSYSKAMAKCDADPNCAGLQSWNCRDNKNFQLCSVGTVVVHDNVKLQRNREMNLNQSDPAFARVCMYVREGFEHHILFGENLTTDKSATAEKFWGQSGSISCDAQHFMHKSWGIEKLLPGASREDYESWNFSTAQKLCDKRGNCGAVVDDNCDGVAFRFCIVGFRVLRSTHAKKSHNVCIYSKKNITYEPSKKKQKDQYLLHQNQQCDVHHTQWDSPYVWWKYVKKECDSDPKCSGLYDGMCNGKGFVKCKEGFSLIPAKKGTGCVYTKPNWTAVSWTKSSTGCKCYFDENRTDCACCNDGACQCSPSISANRCAPCNEIQKCVVSEDLGDFPDLQQKVSPALMARLNDVLDATTYENRQSGIRGFLKAAYELPSSAAKVQAVALLDAKLNREHSGNAPFEFPNATEVEDWLASWFLMDEIWEHANNANNASAQNEYGLPVIKGLQSRGALIQDKFRKCDWQVALQTYFSTQGGYGNWCGKMPPGRPGDLIKMISFGACKTQMHNTKNGKWGLEVCNDTGFDEACSRHDQGAYTTNVFGIATQSLCKVDADFKAAREKLQLDSSFEDGTKRSESGSIVAANCLFDMMPCMRFEEKTYWDWCSSWSGGYPCKKTKVGYVTHWPMGDYSQFKDDACGPPGCYSESKTQEQNATSEQ